MQTSKTFSSPKQNINQLIAISTGHFINDFYVSIIQPIAFVFKETLALTVAQQGMIAFIVTASSTWLQPLMGFLVSRYKKTWLLILSVVWITFWISITGIITNYFLLLTALALGGMASALYHPLGTEAAIELNSKQAGTSVSVFMTVGTLAIAATPIALPIVSRYGLNKLVLFIIPGLMIGVYMYYTKVHHINLPENISKTPDRSLSTVKMHALKWISLLTIVWACKNWLRLSLVTYGAQLFGTKSIDNELLITIILVSHLTLNGLGVLAGGFMADRFGNKNVFIISMVLATSTLALCIYSNGIVSILAFIITGLFLSASNSINIVMGRDHMPEDTSLSSGIIMGLGGGLGGLGVLLQGYLADIVGMNSSFGYSLFPMLLACILVVFLPDTKVNTKRHDV